VENVRKRWRNLRCSMTRYLKSSRNSSVGNGNMPRKYYLADSMQFMIPFLKLKEDNCLRPYVENMSFNEDSSEIVMKIVNDVKESEFQQKQDMVTSDEEEKHEVYEIETLEEDENQTQNQIIEHHTIDALPESGVQTNQQSQQITLTTQYDIDPLPEYTNHQLIASPMKKFKLTEVSSTPPPQTPSTTQYHSSQSQDDADLNFLKSLIPDIQLMNMQQKRKFKVTVLNLIDDLLSDEKS
jgi:hypothetical protein